jgi:hypothetical protein
VLSPKRSKHKFVCYYEYCCRIMIKNINTTNLKTFIQCNQHYTHLQHNDRITPWTLANKLAPNFLFLWTINAYKCGYPNNKQILYRANTQLVEMLVLEMEKTWTSSFSHYNKRCPYMSSDFIGHSERDLLGKQ